MEARHTASSYDQEVWRIAAVLIDWHGTGAAIYAAEQAWKQLQTESPEAAAFWRQITETVLDWYRPEPKTDERLQ